jgi:hypothetical protein
MFINWIINYSIAMFFDLTGIIITEFFPTFIIIKTVKYEKKLLLFFFMIIYTNTTK